MWKRSVFLVLAGLLLCAPAMAAPLYKDLATAMKGQTSLVEGREFKFLVDPAKVNPDMAKAFKEIWDKAKAVAAKQGIQITEREKKPFALTPTVKTFYDTEDMQLWKAGYLIPHNGQLQEGLPQLRNSRHDQAHQPAGQDHPGQQDECLQGCLQGQVRH